MARINIISKSFLEADEMKFILDRLEEQNVTLYSTDQAYEFLGIRAFYQKSKIYFIILIPHIKPGIYNKYLLEAIPINGKVLSLPAKYAISNSEATYFIKGSCQVIERNVLCDINELQDVSRDSCFSKILQGYSGKCILTHPFNTTEIKRLTDNHIIIKNATKIQLSSNCMISNRTLSGTFLVIFSNCSVKVGTETFSQLEMYDRAPAYIVPLDGLTIEESKFEPNISLQQLHEFHIENLERMDYITEGNITKLYTSVGLSSISIFVMIFLAACALTRRFSK